MTTYIGYIAGHRPDFQNQCFQAHGFILSEYCQGTDRWHTVTNGIGGIDQHCVETNSAKCGYGNPHTYNKKQAPLSSNGENQTKETKMTKFVINVAALTQLAATVAEKNEMADFGISISNDAEIMALMAEEQAAARKESTRAAVREIMALDTAANEVMHQQFQIIRQLNQEVANARKKAQLITLARAYGADTRNYMPLMSILGLLQSHKMVDIPADWLLTNSQKVLSVFKEQGQVAKKSPTKATPRSK